MDSTLNYYSKNAKDYFEQTKDASMRMEQDKFLRYLPQKCHILDLGCGSGRDSLSFIKQGYKVTAVDGCKELCDLASNYIGQEVECCDFKDFLRKDTFDGIWACASLLHLEVEDFIKVLKNLNKSLKKDGIMYIGLKKGNDTSSYHGERFFTYYSDRKLQEILKRTKFDIIDIFTTGDVLNRNGVQWINVIVKKKS